MRPHLVAMAMMTLGLACTSAATPVAQPDIKQNPAPSMRYEITATIDDAPGPFDQVVGIADYRVTNELCVLPTPVMGARIVPEKRVPLVFKHDHDNVYRATVFLDLFQDGDYFGKGVCHWALSGAGMELKHNATTFSTALFHDDLVAGKISHRYFAQASYTKVDAMRIDTGLTDSSLFHGKGGMFTVTMTASKAREAQP